MLLSELQRLRRQAEPRTAQRLAEGTARRRRVAARKAARTRGRARHVEAALLVAGIAEAHPMYASLRARAEADYDRETERLRV